MHCKLLLLPLLLSLLVLTVGSVPLLTADRCSGEKGVGRSGKPLHYKNSIFHRIIPNFMVSSTRR